MPAIQSRQLNWKFKDLFICKIHIYYLAIGCCFSITYQVIYHYRNRRTGYQQLFHHSSYFDKILCHARFCICRSN